VRALEAGTLEVGWYELPRGAKLARRPKPRPVLVASGRLGFSAAGSATMTIRLSARGKRLLRHARRRLALSAKGTFTPTGQPAVVGFKRFTLRR
jgi:hypothetical protein